ncbi:MAG: histidine kinase [Bacteroidales bacterium]|nr:histidine kinase [Bacteroidales bacterium]
MKKLEEKRNLLIWLLIWVVFVFNSSRHIDVGGAIIMGTVDILPLLMANQLLRKWMVPRLLQHNRRKPFYLLCLVLLVVLTYIAVKIDSFAILQIDNLGLIDPQLSERIRTERISGEKEGRALLYSKWLILILSACASTIIASLIEERKRMEQAAHEQHIQNELKYLKAQINPHFLFNSLNCIYALTVTQDEQAPESVLKLSEMLRYVIDDCSQDLVPISKEVHYIENYIAFQRIRMEHKSDICFTTDISDSSYPIPPMIFQPIIENCFKHSRIVDHPDGFVHISLKQDSKQLVVVTENSIPQLNYKGEDNERTGIGLQNVEQRLKLIFGDQMKFIKQESDKIFRIELCITF